MSTPIEIVRDGLAKLQDPLVMFHARPEKKAFTTALASVLDDAERFKALERAHADQDNSLEGWSTWYFDTLNRQIMPGTLAELADRLRKET